MAVFYKLVLFAGVIVIGAFLFWVYTRALDFWKLPCSYNHPEVDRIWDIYKEYVRVLS